MIAFWSRKDSENLQRIREILELLVEGKEPTPSKVQEVKAKLVDLQNMLDQDEDGPSRDILMNKLSEGDSIWEEDNLSPEEIERIHGQA